MDSVNTWLIGGGFVTGIVFGALVQRFRYCMVAAIGYWLLIRDVRQVQAFAAAFLVAIGGTQYLELSGLVQVQDASYRGAQLDWLGVMVGGGLFGIGATLAGGCAARTLIRATEGNLQSLLALVSFVLFAAITQFGFFEPVRRALTDATAVTLASDAGIASVLSLPPYAVPVVLTAGLLAFLVWHGRRGMNWPLVIAGAVIGGLTVAGWFVTGYVAQDEFDPRTPSSITMAGPLARLGYLALSGNVPAFSFSISFVLGAALAGLASAVVRREFKLIPVRKGMARYAIVGGALMGIGGILAYGCNVGQGLSGMSTLSVESLLATVSMFAGAALLVKRWEHQEQ